MNTGWGSLWQVVVAIVLVTIVYEYNPRWGGFLLIVIVFGMLLVAQQRGVI